MSSNPPESRPPEWPSVSYRLRRWDVFWSMLHSAFRSGFQRTFFLVLAAAMTALMLREPGLRGAGTVALAIQAFLSFGFFVMLSCAALFVVALAMAFTRPLRGILGEHTIELRADGVMERTDINESLHKWTGVRRVRRAGSYIQIYVTDLMYHSIPVSAFPSREDADSFVAKVGAHIRASQPVTRGEAGNRGR